MASSAFSVLKPPVLKRLEKEGFLEASPIQELSIPAILKGDNVLLIAPTGTGKTLAAILPVLDEFLEARSSEKTHGISILYVTPLRALNRDLLRRLEEMGRDLDVKIQVRHGDTPTREGSRDQRRICLTDGEGSGRSFEARSSYLHSRSCSEDTGAD